MRFVWYGDVLMQVKASFLSGSEKLGEEVDWEEEQLVWLLRR